MRLIPLASALCATIAVAIAGCSDPTSVGSYSISKFTGDNQTVVAGNAVPAAPAVQIIDGNGSAVVGSTVVFAVATGGGTVVNATVVTGDDGIATSGTWTLGATAGVNTLTATSAGISGSPLTFTATGVAIGALVKQSGDNQTSRAGTTLINPVVVTVTDGSGNPIAGAAVNFSVTSGGGSLAAGGNQRQVLTDASGTASTTWNLGTTPGTNTVLVFVSGNNVTGNNATFTATGT